LEAAGWVAAGVEEVGAVAVVGWRECVGWHAVTGLSVERFVTVEGVRLRYLEAGDGPPILLLHGNGAMAEDFVISGVFARLARTHRVVAFDRPGFGFSERPRRRTWTAAAQAALIIAALPLVGVTRPVVVGHSWGALVALAMALDQPAWVAGIALLGGPLMPERRRDIWLFTLPAVPVVGDVLVHTIWPALGRWTWPRLVRQLFAPAPVTEGFARLFPTKLALRPSQLRAGAADLATMFGSAEALAARAGRLDLPVLILSGEGDVIVDPRRHSVVMHEMIGGELCLIAGAGHMVHHTAPEEVAAAIERVCAGG
jgi:pimeloyl-ACP methyl ester carboxylesterase